jgi:hypothetical protein
MENYTCRRLSKLCFLSAVVTGFTAFYNGFFHNGEMAFGLNLLLGLQSIVSLYVGIRLDKMEKLKN